MVENLRSSSGKSKLPGTQHPLPSSKTPGPTPSPPPGESTYCPWLEEASPHLQAPLKRKEMEKGLGWSWLGGGLVT